MDASRFTYEVNQEERLPFWADRKMIGVNE